MLRRCSTIFAFLTILTWINYGDAQDVTRLGGDLTTTLPGHNAIQVYAPNVSSAERRALQLSGFDIFHNRITPEEGVGPRFVNSSCGGCHVQNGRGPIRLVGSGLSSGGSTVIKVSALEAAKGITIGPVLQVHAISGRRFHKLRLKWRTVKGRYPDGKTYALRRPLVSFSIAGVDRRKVAHSMRMSPMLIGMGLFEAIPESAVLALADPTDTDGDGISGKPNYVLNEKTGQMALGRFGFKAGQPSVEQQSAAALINEMGITNTIFPGDGTEAVEFSADFLNRLVIYQQIPGVPAAREQDQPRVQKGKELFSEIGCNSCHQITFVTGDGDSPELVGQEIHPFTDLLLHDMGPGLADKHVEFEATGPEWRTAPLWGLGFSETLSSVSPRYLHDGRARSIEEAILWHAGEAAKTRARFKGLSKTEREAVIAFLRSL